MNIYNVFITVAIVLINLLHSTDNRVLAPLLDAPEYDTTYSICYILTPPSVPLTIDPSPPALAPPFHPDFAPAPPHTFAGATSAGHGTNSFSVDWEINLVTIVFIALIVQGVVNGPILYTGNKSSDQASLDAQDSPPSSPITPVTPPALPTPPTPLSPSWSYIDSLFPPAFSLSAPLPNPLDEGLEKDVLPSCCFYTAPISVSGLIEGNTDISSRSSMPTLPSSSSISDDDGDREAATTSNGVSSVPAGLIASVTTRSVQNILDEITLAFSPSPSPSPVARTPPAVLTISRNLWEEIADARYGEEPSFWDCYPQATPRTPVDLDDEVTDGHVEGVESDVIEPLVRAWTIDGDDTSPAPSTIQDAEVVESTLGSIGSPQGAPSRIPRFAPTPVWKKSIDALISGDRKTKTPLRPVRTPTSTTAVSPVNVTAPSPSSSTSSKPDASKELDWSEDVEQDIFDSSGSIRVKKVCEEVGDSGGRRISLGQDRVFEKCDCALENTAFEPESWNKFKIPASCHPRPSIHFLSPRDTDKCNPSTRIVVDNVNAFHYHTTEPNVPYANKDVEDMFYGVGAKNVRCFDGRIVGGVVRYSTSYAVVDFETVEDAEVAFKMFQGRKAYPGSYHLRLKFVDVNDQSFGKRMAGSVDPTERSEERKESSGFVETANEVDVDLAKVVLPSRPGFTLPARPAALPEL